MKKPSELVYIVWLDATFDVGWVREGVNENALKCMSAGWLMEETERSVTVVASVGCVQDGDYAMGSPIQIPRCAIKKMVKVKPPRWLLDGL